MVISAVVEGVEAGGINTLVEKRLDELCDTDATLLAEGLKPHMRVSGLRMTSIEIL